MTKEGIAGICDPLGLYDWETNLRRLALRAAEDGNATDKLSWIEAMYATQKEKTMVDQATKVPGTEIPSTWQRALEMWDAGEPVPAFQVESESATQESLWGMAFQVLRDASVTIEGFTHREADVIASIVHVAKRVSWPQLIASHVHAKSPALMIKKPKPSGE